MLPSNPRAGGGLPNNPRSNGPGGRQQRRDRPSRGEDNDSSATSSRPSHSHRSTPSARREPSRSRGQGSFDHTSRKSNDSSTSSSSVSSSGSSFLNRIKNGTTGYASSITTVEDDYESDHRKANGRGQVNEDHDIQDDGSAQASEEGYGWTIWGRVATAASSLTVNVSKAWASNIATYAGEETPPGQESRLTRAMKAYHLEKARDPADLPTWLFDEHERRSRRSNARDREDAVVEPREVKPQKSAPPRGLRDVYNAVSTPANIHQSSPVDTAGSNRRAPRKGTDRLKALREAKRPPGTNYTQEESERPRAIPQAPRARVGLPGGPGRNRRV